MQNNATGRLFVSFWNVCLDNLPPGAFRHSLISPDTAKRLIEQARQRNAFLCVSDDDLLAPYRKRERDNHEALCRTLKHHSSIDLSLKDFCSNSGDDANPLFTVNPLNCVQVRDKDVLLIFTCSFALGKNAKAPAFELSPESLAFHLIEAASGEPLSVQVAGAAAERL